MRLYVQSQYQELQENKVTQWQDATRVQGKTVWTIHQGLEIDDRSRVHQAWPAGKGETSKLIGQRLLAFCEAWLQAVPYIPLCRNCSQNAPFLFIEADRKLIKWIFLETFPC